MANRRDYFYKQAVTEDELDGGFNYLELADQALASDAGFVGVFEGLDVVENSGTPDLTVDVALGTAYDADGQRVRVPANQDLDCSVDYLSVSTAVATPGNEKWLSIFAEFDRALSDPRTDGYSQTVYFERAETFTLWVKQGAEAVIPTATKPTLETGAVLLADVYLINAQTQILNADINTDRRQDQIVLTGATQSVNEGTVEEGMQALLDIIEDVIGGSITLDASSIDYAGGGNWANSDTNPATDVESQLDKFITDLANSGAASGAHHLGSLGISGTPDSLSSGTLNGQLAALLTAVNERGRKSYTNTWEAENTFQGTVADAFSPALITTKAPTTNLPLWQAGNATAKARLYTIPFGFAFTFNAEWVSGPQWDRDDTGAAAYKWEFGAAFFKSQVVAAGANPITWKTTQNVNIDNSAVTGPHAELKGPGDATDISRLEIDKSNPAYDASIAANTLYSANIPKVWVNVLTAAGPASSAIEGFNVASISYPAATTMRINFTQTMANANYAVYGSVDYPAALYVDTYNTNYVIVKFYDIAGHSDVDFGVLLRNYTIAVIGKE